MSNELSAWDQLSPQSAHLLLCDLQKQIVARSKTTDKEALARSAGVLLELAKLFALPTTLSVVPEGGKAPELIPELHNSGFAQEKLRSSASPFTEPLTAEALGRSARKVLVVGGFAMEVVVLHAVHDARKQGYQVLIPVDVCGGMSERTEQAALRQIEAAGAISTSVVSIATKLAPDFTTDLGNKCSGLCRNFA
jgi:Isochorismatase family